MNPWVTSLWSALTSRTSDRLTRQSDHLPIADNPRKLNFRFTFRNVKSGARRTIPHTQYVLHLVTGTHEFIRGNNLPKTRNINYLLHRKHRYNLHTSSFSSPYEKDV